MSTRTDTGNFILCRICAESFWHNAPGNRPEYCGEDCRRVGRAEKARRFRAAAAERRERARVLALQEFVDARVDAVLAERLGAAA